MARFWPGPPNDGRQFIDESITSIESKIRMPPVHIQDQLVQVYFTYVNPAVPVVDEESFMAQYQAMYVLALPPLTLLMLILTPFGCRKLG